MKNRNGHESGKTNGDASRVNVRLYIPQPYFDRHELIQIQEGRHKHVRCLELCKRQRDDLVRILREGPVLPQDAELIKTTIALALWSLREQQKLCEMYLPDEHT